MGFSRVASKYTCGIDFCMDFFLGIVVVCRSIIYIYPSQFVVDKSIDISMILLERLESDGSMSK
jgi:hypothetical protein